MTLAVFLCMGKQERPAAGCSRRDVSFGGDERASERRRPFQPRSKGSMPYGKGAVYLKGFKN